MGSGNIPREIYVFGIIIFYVLFGLLYLASLQTMDKIGVISECTSNSLESNDYNPVGVGDSTSGLFDNVFKKISCAGEDYAIINWVFAIFSALIVTMIILALVHG